MRIRIFNPGPIQRSANGRRTARRGFAFALVLTFAVTIFISLGLLFYLTREESFQAGRSVDAIRSAHLSESIHLFLLAQTFGSPWEKRFFTGECQFGTDVPAEKDWQRRLDRSLRDGFFQGAEPDLAYWGRILPIDVDKNHIIETEVRVIRKSQFKQDILLRQIFFDRYKRNVLDTLGDTGSLFRDETASKDQIIKQLDQVSDDDKRLLLGSGAGSKDLETILQEYLKKMGKE